ncbi:SAM-dependent methyltransferase [Azonexus sp.]|uniref:SAM-dependent methyltransferase n=1 Tax=Azonexus sp. TaxID=1872668 RepID=UPI0039E44683
MTGTLYLIPVPLGPGAPQAVLAPQTLAALHPLRHFVVENAKSARAFLKAAGTALPLQELQLNELNEHSRPSDIAPLLAPLLAGEDVGLLSEAGCPAVADPGAALVALAQEKNIRILPLIGPSALLLALMGSGLDGQRFAFHGYLPAKEAERSSALRELEKESRHKRQTQLCIETPYRNTALFAAFLKHCQPTTRLCVASDLSLPSETIRTQTIAAWKKQTPPDLERRPTVFLLLA